MNKWIIKKCSKSKKYWTTGGFGPSAQNILEWKEDGMKK
jgi:hypothetical protein